MNIKPEMWENLMMFLGHIQPKDVKDVKWKWAESRGVEEIHIKFEHPIHLTDKPA